MYLLDAADADVVILICNVMTTPADLMSFTQLDTDTLNTGTEDTEILTLTHWTLTH